MSLFTVGTAGILNGVYRMALVRRLTLLAANPPALLTSLSFLPLLPLRFARSLAPSCLGRDHSLSYRARRTKSERCSDAAVDF